MPKVPTNVAWPWVFQAFYSFHESVDLLFQDCVFEASLGRYLRLEEIRPVAGLFWVTYYKKGLTAFKKALDCGGNFISVWCVVCHNLCSSGHNLLGASSKDLLSWASLQDVWDAAGWSSFILSWDRYFIPSFRGWRLHLPLLHFNGTSHPLEKMLPILKPPP